MPDTISAPDGLSTSDHGFAMVGRFLHNWAIMEGNLRGAIGKALGLSVLQAVFVCANISFRDKINILKTAIDVSHIHPIADRDTFKKLLDTIAGHSTTRNMIAHDMFFPSDDGASVSFFVVKAKGKLALPDEVWTEERFAAENALLLEWTGEIAEITKRLSTASLANALLSAREKTDAPIEAPSGLGILGFPNPLPEGLPHSTPDPSTDETASQIPPEPED